MFSVTSETMVCRMLTAADLPCEDARQRICRRYLVRLDAYGENPTRRTRMPVTAFCCNSIQRNDLHDSDVSPCSIRSYSVTNIVLCYSRFSIAFVSSFNLSFSILRFGATSSCIVNQFLSLGTFHLLNVKIYSRSIISARVNSILYCSLKAISLIFLYVSAVTFTTISNLSPLHLLQ